MENIYTDNKINNKTFAQPCYKTITGDSSIRKDLHKKRDIKINVPGLNSFTTKKTKNKL